MTQRDDYPGGDEHALLLSARAGDERAFGWLVDLHRDGLEQFCHCMLPDAGVAREAVADTVLAAWGERQNVETQMPVRTWLYRIAVRVCLQAIADSGCDEFEDRKSFDGVKSDGTSERRADPRN